MLVQFHDYPFNIAKACMKLTVKTILAVYELSVYDLLIYVFCFGKKPWQGFIAFQYLLWETPAQCASQFTRWHPSTLCKSTFNYFGIDRGWGRERECEAVGRARTGFVQKRTKNTFGSGCSKVLISFHFFSRAKLVGSASSGKINSYQLIWSQC